MANDEHLAILRQGVDVWNEWRDENPEIEPDLQEVDFHKTNLSGVDFFRTILIGANFTEAILVKASLIQANLAGAQFREAQLREASLLGANLTEADLTEADLTEADLMETDLTRTILIRTILERVKLFAVKLYEANIQGASFCGADLRGTSFIQTDLTGASFLEADLAMANFAGTILEKSYLTEASLQGANFKRANLAGAYLQRTDLTATNLSGANLQGADFQEAKLEETELTNTNMTNAKMGGTILADVNLQAIIGLDTVSHAGPSTLGIDTLYRSQGDIPEVFLRGCGVPDSMIEYARSLVAAQRPIDYYSCFISYSSTDEAIARRFHADLQARGVRCWFAPHDLEIGVPIVRGIDEAIRIYDKLLIILSEASVKSTWVAFEVSTALHREIEQCRTMLFPIRLDDAVLHTPSGWAAQLRSRHIGDFRGWKDHDRYQAAFERLLRDLKAKEEERRA